MLCYPGQVRSCIKCGDRKIGCHVSCERYIAESEEHARKKQEWLEAKEKYYKNRTKKKSKIGPYEKPFMYR